MPWPSSFGFFLEIAVVSLAGLGLSSSATKAQDTISTVAGGGPSSGPAVMANISTPTAIAVDSHGNLYVAAAGGKVIYKIDSGGNLSIVAGNGGSGFLGDGGLATATSLGTDAGFVNGGGRMGPSGVAVDSSGNIFIADPGNLRVARVDAITQAITSVATAGLLGFPFSVELDGVGNLFVSDRDNNRVLRVDAVTGATTPFVGTGSATFSGDGGPAVNAGISAPLGLAFDGSGNLFIADSGNQRVRRVDTTGVISTVAGNGTAGFSGDGGVATSAMLSTPEGVTIDSAGNLFISDAGNSRVRRVDVKTKIISTVAGNGTSGFSGDGGAATSASVNCNNYVGPANVVGFSIVTIQGCGLAMDASGNLFITDTGNNRIRKVAASNSVITTVAGNGTVLGDGGPSQSATLDAPFGATSDALGNIFIVEQDHARVRRVDAKTGDITTIAGNGTAGFGGDGGPATSASFDDPNDIAMDSSGNLFVCDFQNNRIRRIDASTGQITTVAGNGVGGFSGDGGPATSASLFAVGVAVDSLGNLFIADGFNHRIRRVDATTGIIAAVAGNGTAGFSGDGGPAISASLNLPEGVAVDSSGNLFIADLHNFRIRRVDASTNVITTVAGGGSAGDGVPATSASLDFPQHVSVDALGNLFIVDPFKSGGVRRVDAKTGIITTVAGSGTLGFSGDGRAGTSARLNKTRSVGVDKSGNLLVSDTDNNRVRFVANPVVPFVSLSPSALMFANQGVGSGSSPQAVTLTNVGSASLAIGSIVIGAPDTNDFSETNTCGTSVAAGANCTISVTFNPTAPGARSATLSITDDAAQSPQTVGLAGTGAGPTASLSATSISFPAQLITTTSAAQIVTLTNNGNAALSVSNISVGGANAGDFAQTNSCGTGVSANGQCTISVTFTPTPTGNRSASITITDNAADSPQSISLSGIGSDFSIVAASGGNCPSGGNCSTSATISAGQTAMYYLQVSSANGFNGIVSLSCSGSPGSSNCSISPVSVPPSGSSSYAFAVTVSNTSGATGAPSATPRNIRWIFWPGPMLLISVLLVIHFFLRRTSLAGRPMWSLVLVSSIVLLFVLSWLGACNGGSSGGGTSVPPPTNATLTITGSSATVKHMLNLSLTVNH